MQQAAHLIVSTSIFTACCALGLCIATEQLILGHMPPLPAPLHAVIFGSSLMVYNLPRIIPRPYGKPRGPQPLRPWFVFCCGLGGLLAAPALFFISTECQVICAALGAFALAYFLPLLPGKRKRLRDFGLMKIVVLTTVWTTATTTLPMKHLGVTPLTFGPELLLRFLLIFALCVLFDIRDMHADSGNGIATLPHITGEKYAYALVYFCLLAFIAVSFFLYIDNPDTLKRLLAAIATGVASAAVATHMRHNRPGRAVFIALTDGMMLLYAVLLVV